MHSLLTECDTVWQDHVDLRRVLDRTEAKLVQIQARVPGVLVIDYPELDTEDGCRRIFEHCLQMPFEPHWWRMMAPIHLTINFPAQVRYCQANRPQIDRLIAQATQRIRTDMTLSHRARPDDITYSEEPLSVVLKDARGLIREHHITIGSPGDELDRMNVPLWHALENAGAFHVMTARSNGRVFGYLMTIIAPCMEASNKTETHTAAFYADPAAPGVGAGLQRAVIAAARERGASVVYSRAGVVGSGSRLGALYKRLGAKHMGNLYALDLT